MSKGGISRGGIVARNTPPGELGTFSETHVINRDALRACSCMWFEARLSIF